MLMGLLFMGLGLNIGGSLLSRSQYWWVSFVSVSILLGLFGRSMLKRNQQKRRIIYDTRPTQETLQYCWVPFVSFTILMGLFCLGLNIARSLQSVNVETKTTKETYNIWYTTNTRDPSILMDFFNNKRDLNIDGSLLNKKRPQYWWVSLRWGWVFLERTWILSGIQFTTHFIDFFVVETKRVVGSFVKVILTER